MEIKSPPRLVALDTQVFENHNFNYSSQIFRTLATLSKEEKIKLFLTSVTYHEIKSHITEGAKLTAQAVEQAVNDLKKKRFKPQGESKRIRISANSDSLASFKKSIEDYAPTFEQINQELLEQFEAFMQEAKVSIVDIGNVSPVTVFESYFAESPPFGSGKKKYEFPDAFALLALKKEAESRGTNIYVISDDSDWKNFCASNNDLFCIENLDELLETIIRENESDEVDICYELYAEKESDIKKYIEKKFPELDFSIDLSGSSLIEWGSEEIEVEVQSVNILESSLVHIDDSDTNHPSVTFELLAEINYKAKVSYESLEYAIYDREDDRYYGGETIKTNFFESTRVDIEVSLTLRRDKDYSLCNAEIDDIIIDPNQILGEIIIDTGFSDFY